MREYSLQRDPHLPLSCSSYNTGPHRKIINRWVGWEQLPVRAAKHLGKQASLFWFPGWKEEGMSELDRPSEWAEPEKLDRNHRYLSVSSPVSSSTHPLAQVCTHKPRNWEKQLFQHKNLPWGLAVLWMRGFATSDSWWLVLWLFVIGRAHNWVILDSKGFSQACGHRAVPV